MTRRRWRQDRTTGKLTEIPAGGTFERGNVGEGFISPVDGTIVSTQLKLHDHNRRNNVEQTTDGHFQDWDVAQKKRDEFHSGRANKEERILALRRAMGDEV